VVAKDLVATVNEALRARGFIDYRRSFDVAKDAEEVLDELESYLDSGAADAVRPRCGARGEHCDCNCPDPSWGGAHGGVPRTARSEAAQVGGQDWCSNAADQRDRARQAPGHSGHCSSAGRYFGTTDRFWVNLQTRFDIEVEKDKLGAALEAITPLH
jgi:hypothetical protein